MEDAAMRTIAVRQAELLELKRRQLADEEAGRPKPTLSQIIRRALDALAAIEDTAGNTKGR